MFSRKNNPPFLFLLLITLMTLSSLVSPLEGQANSTENLPKDMVYIPFGQFLMGIDKQFSTDRSSTNGPSTLYHRRMSMPWSKEAFHDEGPAHWVVLDPYFIDKFEVSNHDFGEFIESTGHPAPAYWDDPRLNKPRLPVVGVNWHDATAFCEWKGKRLPTEAEWEKAARGPEGYRYPWGNDLDPLKANYGAQQKATLPVDSKQEGASFYGVYHMAGNVFEWVQDWYDPNYYQKTQVVDNPAGPEKPIWLGGTGTYVDRLTVGEKRVIRGGSWIAAEGSITATHRFWNHPMNNSYGVGLGFRCAKTAPLTIDTSIREAYISTFVSMGAERFQEAKEHIERAIQLDPTNKELLEVRDLIQASM